MMSIDLDTVLRCTTGTSPFSSMDWQDQELNVGRLGNDLMGDLAGGRYLSSALISDTACV